MGKTREELRNEIRRNLGYPLVKVELTDDQINDAIARARALWIKWTAGNATKEVYFTLLLRAGQRIYDLPAGVTEIVDYIEKHQYDSYAGLPSGGINELFTFENYLYNQGYYNLITQGFDQISLYIAKDFLSTLEMFAHNKYRYRYHRHTNQLEIYPIPSCNDISITSFSTKSSSGGMDYDILSNTFRTPGTGLCSMEDHVKAVNGVAWVLVKAYMVEGSTLPTYTPLEETVGSLFEIDKNYSEYLYDEPWIIEFTEALCKVTLGNVRRKFGSFNSIGNTGISLDGDTLVSEGLEQKRDLEEKLKTENVHVGYGISVGI